MKLNIFLLIAWLWAGMAGAALAPAVSITVRTNNLVDGPRGAISTTGTTTAGIQEAINAAITAISISSPPPGGAEIVFAPGMYPVTGQILLSNRFANPITLRGSQVGPTPSAIIKYSGTTNMFQTTAPSGSGVTALYLKNLSFTSEAVTTNRLFRLTDVYHLRGEDCTFAGWGYFTNNGLSGFINNSPVAQGTGLVAIETGDGADYTAGVVEMINCRFWGLAAGVATTTDHQFQTDCSFALEGGLKANAPPVSLWLVGASYHYPESCYALYPGWVNNSTGGDVVFKGRWSSFYNFCSLLNVKHGLLGHPTLTVETAGQLEGSAWLVLQYDDIATEPLDIRGPATVTTRSGISTVHKPGTITGVLPPNTHFSGFGTETAGETNLLMFTAGSELANQYSPFPTSIVDGGPGPTVLLDGGDIAGRTILRGTNYLDHLETGVAIDLITPTVTGGTDTGINTASSAYRLKGRVARTTSAIGFAWTNATYTILQNSVSSAAGGFYLKSDTTFANELYYNATPVKLGPDYFVAAAGVYDTVNGIGTPPTVAFAATTNTAKFFGGISASGIISGNGAGLTNIQATSVAPTLIQTNFGSGFVYSNFYGVPIEVSANVVLTEAAVAGVSKMDLRISGVAGTGTTNSVCAVTAIGIATGSLTNYLAGKVPAGSTYTFTNTSTGSGNSTLVSGGQLIVY